MEQEGGSDLIQLWLAVDNFQQQLTKNVTSGDGKSGPANDWEQDQNDAMVIYDRCVNKIYKVSENYSVTIIINKIYPN